LDEIFDYLSDINQRNKEGDYPIIIGNVVWLKIVIE
jgi:hypothetical protein